MGGRAGKSAGVTEVDGWGLQCSTWSWRCLTPRLAPAATCLPACRREGSYIYEEFLTTGGTGEWV